MLVERCGRRVKEKTGPGKKKKRQDPEKRRKDRTRKKKKRQEPAKTEASCKATFRLIAIFFSF